MTLLRLSPDGERLRRIAKAHAAGELSTPDYRRIRSDVIESFAQDGADDVAGDVTQQRRFERPMPLPPIADHVEDTLRDARKGSPQRAPDAPPSARPPSPRLRWLAISVVVLAIVIATVMV
jgi:hypothetical protein